MITKPDKIVNHLQCCNYKSWNMKITPETKIKDLISDEYEVDNVYGPTIHDGQKTLFIMLKKKEEKNFDWYVKEYLGSSSYLIDFLTEDYSLQIGNDLLRYNFKNVPFEYRIGLLKFICDNFEIKGNYIEVLNSWKNAEIKGGVTIIIQGICPKEFIDSLID